VVSRSISCVMPTFSSLDIAYSSVNDKIQYLTVCKKSFVSDIEQFWRKIHDASGVKNCKLFEGVSPSSCNLARRVMNPKIACGANKIRLFTSS